MIKKTKSIEDIQILLGKPKNYPNIFFIIFMNLTPH